MLRIECRCGEVYHADAQHAGRRIRCRCGRTLRVRAPRRSMFAGARTGAIRRLHGIRERLRRPALLRTLPTGPAALRTERAAWACLALAAASALLLWGFADRWWPATALLFGPRWLLLLPVAAGAVAAARYNPRALPVLAAAALIVLGPVMGLRTGLRGLFARGEPLRVVSFNAEGRPDAMLALLQVLSDERVDIAAVQECAREVSENLALQLFWHLRSDGSLCLLSRFPIASAEYHTWRELDIARQSGVGGSGELARYRVTAPAGELHIANVHLETPRRGLRYLRYALRASPVGDNTMIRRLGSRRAFAALGEQRDELIVLGDFNMPVESSIYRENWGEFANAFSRAGRGFGTTKDNGWIQVRIDHVLSGSAWRPRSARVGPRLGSDHSPVIAELRRSGWYER